MKVSVSLNEHEEDARGNQKNLLSAEKSRRIADIKTLRAGEMAQWV